MKHKHAELMMEYAKDALETDKPWERWEHKNQVSDEWRTFTHCHPDWNQDRFYRRKPRTININGFEVPEPYRGEMKYGSTYYFPWLEGGKGFGYNTWQGDEIDGDIFKNGALHLTKEAAILHSKALLSFTKGGDQ